jgi:hypothetical protein
MAIRGPKGPPPDAKTPQALDPSELAQETAKQQHAKHTQPTADEFERIAESMAGSDFDQSDSAKRRKRGHTHRRHAIFSRAVSRIGSDLEKFQREAAQILSVIAAQAFSTVAVERHKRELARLRKRIERAYRHILKSQRALREKELGLDAIETSKLEKVEQELERLNQFETHWGKAMAAFELSCEAASDGQARRLKIQDADYEAARDYATISNPNTIAIDLATSALMFLEAAEAPPKTQMSKSKLGPSLKGQETLQRIISPPTND